MIAQGRFPAIASPATLLVLLLGLVPFGPAGCASQPDLTLTSLDHRQTYRHAFTQAYTSRNDKGDVDVVLVDQATEQSMSGDAMTAPVRQVMHFQIMWSPTRAMKSVTSNACVKWYVIGRTQPQDVLEYTGIAFVSMKDDDSSTMTLKVSNATLKPCGAHGSLIDPVGSSRVEGTFVARQDDELVKKVLGNVKTSVAASGNSATPVASSGMERAIVR